MHRQRVNCLLKNWFYANIHAYVRLANCHDRTGGITLTLPDKLVMHDIIDAGHADGKRKLVELINWNI